MRDSDSVDEILTRVRRLPVAQRQELLARIEEELVRSGSPELEPVLSVEGQRELWQQWVEAGPQGPLEDSGAPEFP